MAERGSERASEQRRILDLLAAGQISVDEATELLAALGTSSVPPAPPAPPSPPRGIARLLRISIDADGEGADKAKIRVNVPIGLAKFATRFLPKEAKQQLEAQGVDLSELLDSLGSDLPEGRLIDIDAGPDAEGGKAKIIIDVV